MGLKMNSRIIKEYHEVDPVNGFLTKSISKPYGRATAMPPAWELIPLIIARHTRLSIRGVRSIENSNNYALEGLSQGYRLRDSR